MKIYYKKLIKNFMVYGTTSKSRIKQKQCRKYLADLLGKEYMRMFNELQNSFYFGHNI